MQNQRLACDFARAHLQYPRPTMAHPVQRLYRLPLLSPRLQCSSNRFQWVLPGLQPEHRYEGFSQQLSDFRTFPVGDEQRARWACR